MLSKNHMVSVALILQSWFSQNEFIVSLVAINLSFHPQVQSNELENGRQKLRNFFFTLSSYEPMLLFSFMSTHTHKHVHIYMLSTNQFKMLQQLCSIKFSVKQIINFLTFHLNIENFLLCYPSCYFYFLKLEYS